MKPEIEEIRKKSIEVFATERRKALHEAYFNTPIVAPRPSNANTAAAAASSTSGGGGRPFDNTRNNYVENGYVEDYFE